MKFISLYVSAIPALLLKAESTDKTLKFHFFDFVGMPNLLQLYSRDTTSKVASLRPFTQTIFDGIFAALSKATFVAPELATNLPV